MYNSGLLYSPSRFNISIGTLCRTRYSRQKVTWLCYEMQKVAMFSKVLLFFFLMKQKPNFGYVFIQEQTGFVWRKNNLLNWPAD